ncbi:hypothetical protein [Soonwooa sp.]|nr:hypothetical protein [Soonwooa sp.]
MDRYPTAPTRAFTYGNNCNLSISDTDSDKYVEVDPKTSSNIINLKSKEV